MLPLTFPDWVVIDFFEVLDGSIGKRLKDIFCDSEHWAYNHKALLIKLPLNFWNNGFDFFLLFLNLLKIDFPFIFRHLIGEVPRGFIFGVWGFVWRYWVIFIRRTVLGLIEGILYRLLFPKWIICIVLLKLDNFRLFLWLLHYLLCHTLITSRIPSVYPFILTILLLYFIVIILNLYYPIISKWHQIFYYISFIF